MFVIIKRLDKKRKKEITFFGHSCVSTEITPKMWPILQFNWLSSLYRLVHRNEPQKLWSCTTWARKPGCVRSLLRGTDIDGSLSPKVTSLVVVIWSFKKENIVLNLCQNEVPVSIYLYLTKVLRFVPSMEIIIQDLKSLPLVMQTFLWVGLSFGMVEVSEPTSMIIIGKVNQWFI